MLDRTKLIQDVYALASKLFPDLQGEHDLALQTWKSIAHDETFTYRAKESQSSFLIPSWQGSLTDVYTIDRSVSSYTAIAVDGSQIYPDRHVSGAGCVLLNTGGVVLRYDTQSSASFFSEPHVLLPHQLIEGLGDVPFSRDLVDLKREEYELAAMQRAEPETYCFIDGTIIFWNLESKQPSIKTFFLQKYLAYLEDLYCKNVLYVGYISMPKSRELVNLIKLGLCRFSVADCIPCHSKHETFPCKQVDHMVDTGIMRYILKPYQRSTIFYSTSNIVSLYPDHLRPAFVYCHVGSEIVRLEFPSWIAQHSALVERVCEVAIDQALKGYGYPVCLAEAHEQAVVKGADREFFYQLLYKIGIDHNKTIKLSEKAMKKRRIGI